MTEHNPSAFALAAEAGEVPEEAIRRLAYENEVARRRALNNIPDGFLTPTWLELAIEKDWTFVRGAPSEVRARAEAEARVLLTDAELQAHSRNQRAFARNERRSGSRA